MILVTLVTVLVKPVACQATEEARIPKYIEKFVTPVFLPLKIRIACN